MIKSMTAFSRAEQNNGSLSASVEIRSYNNRYLDLILRIPQPFISLEDRIKTLISGKITRGRLEVRLQVDDTSDSACVFEIDETRAQAYHEALIRLGEVLGLEKNLSLSQIASMPGLIRQGEVEKDTEAYWPVIEVCIREALDGLEDMRKKEGEFLARDFEQRLTSLEQTVVQIEKDTIGILERYQERLKERIADLTRGIVEIDPMRIAQEAAFLADKSDISEEIVRSKSHIEQFRAIMASEEPGGRKLNFLLQELNREFNTMGSKSGNADISHAIVWLKSELEKIREQIQNVE
jgi:uncharacterized protein (TIGR00255 family)